jgi:allophanate hydrolase subunit 1
MNIIVEIIGLALSLLMSIVAIVVVFTKMGDNVDALKEQQRTSMAALDKQEERMSRKIEEAVGSLNDLVVTVERHMAQQAEINKVVAKSLESVVERCETCRSVTIKQDGVAALLAELLKHKKIIELG